MIKKYHKNGNQFYEVKVAVRDVDGKQVFRKRRNIKTELEAKELEFQLKAELSHHKSKSPMWTWSKWHAESLKLMSVTLKPQSLYNYDGRITKRVPQEWNKKELSQITKSDVLKLIQDIQNEEEGKVSAWYFLKLIKRVFQMAVEEGILDKNPADTIRLRPEKAVPRVLNTNEVNKLLHQAHLNNHRFYAVWVVALMTGMRSGELYALRWEDVDFDTNFIKVTKAWTNKLGVTSTKTGESRVVPMSGDLRSFLMELKLEANGTRAEVLPRLKEWENGAQAEVLRDFCKLIGITPVKFHDLRATFITNLLAQGVPLVRVMAIVGHRKMATTDGYLRLSGVDLQGATESLTFNLPTNAELARVLSFPGQK